MIDKENLTNILEELKDNISNYFNEKYKKNYIIRFFNWLKLHFYFHFKTTTTTKFKKYEIYWIHFWINIWTEFWEKRPWIIFKSNKFIRWKDIIVLPITSLKEGKKYWELDIKIKISDKNNLKLNSIVKLEHIKSISKMRIWDYIWIMDDNYKKIIEEKIKKMILQ